MIHVVNKRTKPENIAKRYPGAVVLDVTSTSNIESAQMLSPYYPHGNIPIPFSGEERAMCVEGIWQGLKVFETEDVNLVSFRNDTMKNIKRSIRKHGKLRGHRKGIEGEELLCYFDARMQIYLPSYKWVLDNVPQVKQVIDGIKAKIENKNVNIVLLDYNTNTDYRDLTKPLSHAGLLKLYIEGNFPNIECYEPLTEEKKGLTQPGLPIS